MKSKKRILACRLEVKTIIADIFAVWIQLVLLGVLLGGLYALIGIGFSLVFGVIKVGNVAHGDFMILAAYLSLSLVTSLGFDPLVSLIILVPFMFIIGFSIQKFLYNRLMHKGSEPILITAFFLSIIIQNMLLLLFKEIDRTLATPYFMTSFELIGTYKVPISYFVDFLLALVSAVILYMFLHKTYLGIAIRAAADDPRAAELLGIKTNDVYAYCFGISLIFAAIAGVLVGMTFIFNFSSGVLYLGTCLCVAVIGGVGSMKGTFIGGIILGVSQVLGGRIFGVGYQVFIGYIILVLILVIKPQGLFGTRGRKGG
jgi:branched-chain amino acid transport system permease protein